MENRKEVMIKEIINILKVKSTKDYKKGVIKRGAHPKCLGLLKGYFCIDTSIDKNLTTDLFKPGCKYPCFIRFSSGGNKVKSDKTKDIRGMSIKLIGVNGKKYGKDEKYTQDFTMLTIKTMPVGDLKTFRDSLYCIIKKKNPILLMYKLIKKRKINIINEILKNRKNQTSPLDVSYFSTTPYQYKDKIIKYCVIPKSNYKSKIPKKMKENYLTENMQKHLNLEEAKFEFFIQLQTNDKEMPINDSSIEWSELKSPFIKVGEIIIPKQEFDNSKRYKFAENMSFSPGNSTLQHKPVGDINIARVKIYSELSKFRHIRNKTDNIEPDLNDFKKLR